MILHWKLSLLYSPTPLSSFPQRQCYISLGGYCYFKSIYSLPCGIWNIRATIMYHFFTLVLFQLFTAQKQMTAKLHDLERYHFILSWLWELSGLCRWFCDVSWVAVSAGARIISTAAGYWLGPQPEHLHVVLATWLGFPHSMMAGFKNECPKKYQVKLGNLSWPSPSSQVDSLNYVLVTGSHRFKGV